MSRDLGRDVPDLEKLYARKLWADFSYPRGGFDVKGSIVEPCWVCRRFQDAILKLS